MNFEASNLNFEAPNMDFEASNLNFEAPNMDFEAPNVNFEAPIGGADASNPGSAPWTAAVDGATGAGRRAPSAWADAVSSEAGADLDGGGPAGAFPMDGSTDHRRRLVGDRFRPRAVAEPYLLIAAGLVLVVVAAGCGALQGRSAPIQPDWVASSYRPEVLRTWMNEYTADFGAAVETAAERIRRESDDPEVRRSAMVWKISAVPAVRKAAFRIEPVAAMLDVWTLAAQMDAMLGGEAGEAAFGPHRAIATDASAATLREIRSIVRRVTGDDEMVRRLEENFIDPWIDQHPMTSITLARGSSMADYAEWTRERVGTLDQVASLERQVATLGTQARLYLGDVSKMVRWEAELVREDMLDELELDRLRASIESLAESAKRATAVAESTPGLVAEERAVVLGEVDRQRTLVMDDVSAELEAARATVEAERLAILEAIAAEREIVVRAVTDERAAVLEDVSAQRLETLDWIEDERDELVGIARAEILAVVDRVLLRVVVLIALAVVLAPIVAHVYALVWPRRRAPRAAR